MTRRTEQISLHLNAYLRTAARPMLSCQRLVHRSYADLQRELEQVIADRDAILRESRRTCAQHGIPMPPGYAASD